MRERVRAAGLLAGGVCLLVSACGAEHRPGTESGGYAQPSSAAPESPEPPSGPGPMEIVAKETRWGRILVDGDGMTIYVSERDNADFESTCTGPCTKEWPPLFTNGQVNAGPGVNSAWLGTIGRSDGPTQVEYNGWPLYHSARDTAPGEIKGQGATAYGGRWYVIDADKGRSVR
ncbi:hypothetical protein [Actinomadura sp. DC4]|uniref:COG4315 family predicted lipoprotein n=1 Tax=Actinomadura sp. DC4 TaxID=3055069 RepID=UPI0025B0EF3D|nr:hypothetical protein [Actinomadura sp. DC4]MDN3352225.1 hypothetical protein [Actinomadura sp. DC4]